MKASQLLKDSREEFGFKHVELKGNNGKIYKVKIANKLKETSIMEIVDQMLQRAEMCKKECIRFNVLMSTYALLLKHFTDIEFSKYPNVKKEYVLEIEVLECLINLNMLDQLLSAFDGEEIKKVQEMFAKYSKTMKLINNNIINQDVEKGERDGESTGKEL